MLQRTAALRSPILTLGAILIALAAVFAPPHPAAAVAQANAPTMPHHFHDANRWAKVFESPERAKWQKPGQVVAALKIKPGQSVADIGAGTGYFTRRFAAAVGSTGEAIGLDIEPAMVAYMKQDAARRHLKNYTARVSQPEDARLAPHSVNLIFFCDVYHHIPDRIAYLKKLAPALRPDGRIALIDFHHAAPVGPPAKIRIPRTQAIAEFREAGYRLTGSHDFLPYQYFLEFQPVGANTQSGAAGGGAQAH